MWSNPQIPADLVKFTEEIINGKLHFLCSVRFLQVHKYFLQIFKILLLLCSAFLKKDSCKNLSMKSFGLVISLVSTRGRLINIIKRVLAHHISSTFYTDKDDWPLWKKDPQMKKRRSREKSPYFGHCTLSWRRFLWYRNHRFSGIFSGYKTEKENSKIEKKLTNRWVCSVNLPK